MAEKLKLIENTRAHQAGTQMADSIIEMIHLMYQKRTAKHFITGIMRSLQERRNEFE